MRNLKRVLALALALVMMLGMMITASAATYSDAAAIDEDYVEAVEVLSGMGVFKGTGAGFAPKAILSRAEAAALIYRVISADVKDSKIDLYDYSSFDDVAAGQWYTPYVTYAANGGYILGYDGNFMPNDKVTGIQVLAIMLRAMGYGQKGEFEGAAWKDNVLTTADDLGILDNVNVKSLDVPASREIVAQLLFDAIQAPTTTYTPAFGYYPNNGTSLGVKKFGLTKVPGTADEWGRPGYKYTYTTGNKVTAFAEPAIATYTVATTECQIASDLKLKGNAEYPIVTYVNGVNNKTTTSINPVDVVNKVGAQGRLVEVYEDRLVIIDTYLAKVTKVVPAKFDAAGHMISEATLYMDIYDDRTAAMDCYTTNGDTNFTYVAGDYVLVNAWGVSVAQNERVLVTNTSATQVPAWEAAYVEIVGLAPSTVGAQTIIWQNTAKHTVAGVTYDDACQYDLDDAGNIPNAQFTWFFDSYGNLIGSAAIQATYDYATIANIQWLNPASVNGYAQATLVYTNGTTESVVVSGIDKNEDWDIKDDGEVLSYTFWTGDYENGYVSMNYGYNAQFIGEKLFAVAKDANGIATLSEIKTVKEDVAVTKGNPVIATGCYIDDNTQFLVRTGNTTIGYTYTPVTGYNQINSITDANVYYVNLDTDAAAEIVYMYGTAATTVSANLVYVNSLAYSYIVGTNDYVTLKDAQVKGATTDVTVGAGLIDPADGADKDLVAGNLYYMVDNDGDGKYKILDGDVVEVIGTDEVSLANGVKAKKIAASAYDILANALEVTGEVVPYNITNAETYGTWTGAENIVIVYKDYNVSAIYVVK